MEADKQNQASGQHAAAPEGPDCVNTDWMGPSKPKTMKGIVEVVQGEIQNEAFQVSIQW